MADKYASFQELERGERRGVYRVRSCLRRATIAVIAPHGGSIEPGTSEIARKIAGADFSIYAFEKRSSTIIAYMRSKKAGDSPREAKH